MASYKNGAAIQGGFVNDPASIYGDKLMLIQTHHII